MAMDGSFSLELSLKRFLSRCPELNKVQKLYDLVNKGHNMMEEEVINLVAELFLNPNYTIPLIGCFRPLVHRILAKAVSLLGRLNLSSNLDDAVVDPREFFYAKDAYIVDQLDQSGRGLILHELACLAFCRALDMDSSLLGLVLTYFKFAPPPFERILRKGIVSEQFMEASHCLLTVRLSYRLLLVDPELFSLRWDWSCFLELVEFTLNPDLIHGFQHEVISDIRWCGIQILSVALKMSDKVIENFGVGAEEAASCFLRWDDFIQDVAIEKVGLYVESSGQLSSTDGEAHFGGQSFVLPCDSNSLALSSSCKIEPVTKSRRLISWGDISNGNPFVMTSAMQRSFGMVQLAASQRWSILLYGPAGAGKTALINKLSQDSGNKVLTIHMDDQIDGKTLIGSYVCAEQPGEFRWQPGSLIQAVLNGYWVVFEDIDKAPSDVQSILLPLLEGANFFITGHGEEIRVPESFRLFSTISTSKVDGFSNTEGGNLLSILWRRVMIGLPNHDDLQNILKAWFPNLECLSGKLVETFERVNHFCQHHIWGFQPGNSSFSGSQSRFSIRDLLKWCKRISALGLNPAGDVLTTYQCRCIYQEAIDIFAAFSASSETRIAIMKEIAKLWQIPPSEAEILYPYKPEIQGGLAELRIGRVTIPCTETSLQGPEKLVKMRSSLHVLEQITCSVKHNEPVLLVGETGTGKTTLVQNLATMLGQRLTVLNLSQQSDIADLLGGFKPIDPQSICVVIFKEFESLFTKSFSLEEKQNEIILQKLHSRLGRKRWTKLLNGIKKCVKIPIAKSGTGKKRKKQDLVKSWENFSVKLETAIRQIGASSGMLFSFVEGAFVTALRNGDWILLDEINLAPPETLQRIIGVLEGDYGSLCLAERGDISHIPRHRSFRIFGCMNPATDAGKRDLPCSLRSRFTEYFVDDVLDKEDLKLFINKFMEETRSNSELEQRLIDFYETAKLLSEERLQDGANQKPQYSLRSLYRALEYTREAKGQFGFQNALYDGFCMFFRTMLDKPSAEIMKELIESKLLGGKKPSPEKVKHGDYLKDRKGSSSDDFLNFYVITDGVEKQLKNLARAVFIKRYPVLLQGPTSSGKTSLVRFLAAKTGCEFVRINNHEHTDLQEYLGSYISDAHGKLIFQEGVLVKAVRNGYWIVLDELNLAPSDVLEALNRLLDDNRELFVPELRETIRAHPNFMLFATQNPPTFYGGRKMLSRAFRNRFVEVHVDEIPNDELIQIIAERCGIAPSRSKIMVDVMKELQLHRQRSKVFAGKHGFITPRDLFRWANRFKKFEGSDHYKKVMAEQGYYLLADRLRDDGEKLLVQEVLEKHLHLKIEKDSLYTNSPGVGSKFLEAESKSHENIILTRSMSRLYFLVKLCYELHEPVLLVGETGGGKTTVCQLLSSKLGSKLHILNCHQYSETSDFVGGFYPIRERSRLTSEYKYAVEKLKLSKACVLFPELLEFSCDIGQASSTLDNLSAVIDSYRQSQVSCPDVTEEDFDNLEETKLNLSQLYQKWQTIFTWQDGPLVEAMRAGDLFLVDEISLADDSVLERLNSVLEPERKLSLAEKGGPIMENITAHENFLVLATMNPGGDYGKKELSPALRNRFTEIWVPPVGDLDELRDIASIRFSGPEFSYIIDSMIKFWEWFNQLQAGRTLTVRDLLSWAEFVNMTKESLGPDYALLHGLFLVLLDGLCLGTGISKEEAGALREKCLSFLVKQLKECLDDTLLSKLSNMEIYGWGDLGTTPDISCSDDMPCDNVFGISPFYVEKGDETCETSGFEFLAPTTRRNAVRVLRAMQLSKPVLLEGSPGVGKTSLITALGKYSGHKVVRINLSEQTDLMDLLGSDLPIESDEGMKFAWSDGILLQALKEGCWILLDELNLAPQSVLEGLNAILDHRAEVFIPELGLTFKCPSSFRVFACQNPFSQGGGRKGLPRSFLNRFTKVYIDELVDSDYLFISSSLYPSIPRPVLSKLISFNKRLHEDVMVHCKFAQVGSPWEFNLRDVIRSCEIIEGAPEVLKTDSFIDILYIQRMRTPSDRKEVLRLYEEVFGVKPLINPYPRVQVNSQYFIVGNTAVKRNCVRLSKYKSSQLNILPSIRHSLEAAMHCLQHNWLCILVGPSSTGKTSLIRLLAELTGNILNEINLSSATDISELLGCFEQFDAYRNFKSILSHVERYVAEYCSLLKETFCKRKEVISKYLSFSSRINSSLSTSSLLENWQSIISSLDFLVEFIDQLKLDVVNNKLPVSWSINDLNRTLEKIPKLREHLQRRNFSAKFEWVAGVLIKAIENGEWIVLENANLCNPTVLDRINSLVEPSGTITVNECGVVDGSPVVLHPHPNFQMFLTVNPKYGEVSRAMRNRGVEIFMMQPYWLLDEGSSAEFELKDVKRFIVLSGVPVGSFVESMANAHVYARNEGLCLNVQITYLELARWIKLFHQLLINGRQPFWSLQKSWEYTYLSALGEPVGWDIINHAKLAFLSVTPQTESNLSIKLSLNSSMMLKLNEFIFYSKEASVRQNCMYLEYLISQYEFKSSSSDRLDCGFTCVNNPKATCRTLYNSSRNSELDLKLAKKMIIFAANWTIEQATEIDYNLYFLWFSWLSLRLNQGHCFHSFAHLLKQEFEHSIWKYIFHCHHKLVSLHQLDLNSQPVPLLSLDFVYSTAPSDTSKESPEFLSNAINSVGLLRLSYDQWNVQSSYDYTNKAQHFKLVLDSLLDLEKEILDMLVKSPSHDVLIQLYTRLLDDHIAFWEAFLSLHSEHLLFSWHFLVKDVLKLRDFCPRAAENVLMIGSKHLGKEFFQVTHQSLLWIHGGHPILPPSSKLYHKQQQVLELCDSIWQLHENPYDQGTMDCCITRIIAASDPELRFLALQGICMSLYITCKRGEDHDKVVQQLEEMQQILSERFGFEKRKLESKLESYEHLVVERNSASCCVFFPHILYKKSGFASWKASLPIVDSTSIFLDMELLQKLSTIVLLDPRELQLALEGVSDLLESSLKYSLKVSARPPQNFIPHQKLLWTLEAWSSIDTVNAKVVSYVLEMWFWWHLCLWNLCPVSAKSCSIVDGYDIPAPAMLAKPVKTETVIHIIQSSCSIKDYFAHLLKLEIASHNFWESPQTQNNLPSFLSSVACSLLQQIIYAHKRVYDADKFARISSIFSSFQKNNIMQIEVQNLSSLIESSNDQQLNSLMHPLIEPLLRDLYLDCSPTDLYLNVGYAWLRIGGLRFRLLLCGHAMDPALKYAFKHEQIEEKISLLQLENKVREECNYLAGWSSPRVADENRVKGLETLEVERKRLQRKMVFRSNPSKFNALKRDCKEFLQRVMIVMDLAGNVELEEFQQVLVQVCDWQKTASCFIEQLSDDYKEYVDVAQPIQVAIYEMKLGLSLIISGALFKRNLVKAEVDNMKQVTESIYSFMRFPRGCTLESVWSSDMGDPSAMLDRQASLLEKLLSLSSEISAERGTSALQLRSSLHLNILVRVAHFVADARRMDSMSFKLLDKMFNEFASLWMEMKMQVKSKEGYDAQQYKFRPRAFEMKHVMDLDISSFGMFLSDDNPSEWLELLSADECLEKVEVGTENENLEEEWNLLQEEALNNVIQIHNHLFGSIDLGSCPGTFCVPDADRLISFTNSYKLGAGIIRGLGGPVSSSLDAQLVPEHLLCLCLEHEQMLVSSHKASSDYNFYKDSNASELSKMVKLILVLQQRIISLLHEWEDHPGLQKTLEAIEVLLAIPMDTPLGKAILGLRFLLNRARVLEENGSKFSLSDQLEPIIALLCSWQKMEYDSWATLINEVQGQYEMNASKLWFPLFSVLRHNHAAEVPRHEQSTIESLEEFINTSSIGEFRKRLQLLFAFLNQIIAGRCLEVATYSSPWQDVNIKILYNVFGYYVQFLPRILEHIETCRRNIEMELKEHLKLCRWERVEVCLLAENSKRNRQKLKKIIQKYSENLQPPVMLIINQVTVQKGITAKSLQGHNPVNDISDASSSLLNAVLDKLCDKDRHLWISGWKKNMNDTLHSIYRDGTSDLCSPGNEDVRSVMQLALHSQSVCAQLEQWKAVHETLEKLCRATIDCDNLWKDMDKSLGKKRVFSELLKMLESSGLHKHKFEIMKISNNSNWLLIQPSYDLEHLLLTSSRLSHGASVSSEVPCQPEVNMDTEWKTVNEFYFKSTASVQLLQRVCLKPHVDISYEQASRSLSFLNHLIVIQQSQRAAAYDFSKHLKCLRESLSALMNLYSRFSSGNSIKEKVCCISPRDCTIIKCMWKQKQLFDSLVAILVEESLLLKTVGSTHSKSCQSIKPETHDFLQLIENFVPVMKKSKESLDNYLVGGGGIMQTLMQDELDKNLLRGVGALSSAPFRPYVISKQMEELVDKNFQVIKEFEEHLLDFNRQNLSKSSVLGTLLHHFDDAFQQAKLLVEELEKSPNESTGICEEPNCFGRSCSELDVVFAGALKKTCEIVANVLKTQFSLSVESALPEESLENITSWEVLFKSSAEALNIEGLYDNLLHTIFGFEKMMNHSGFEASPISFHIGACFEHLHSVSDLLLTFGDHLLHDLLAMHKTVSMMTHVLANVLASLFSKGFGIPSKEEENDSGDGKSQDATGTGMGEGSGVKDVSEEITDEDQLLGTSEKPSEEQDASGEAPNKNGKGIEMEQDFAADTYSVSEDSEEDNGEDGEDGQLESAMGETGPDSEAVDEKLWDKEEDENPGDKNDKNESGPLVTDKDASSRELRAKDDSDAAEEPGELNAEEVDKQSEEAGSPDDTGDKESMDDMHMDKDDSPVDPTGLQVDELEKPDEDLNLDEGTNGKEELDSMEEMGPENGNESAEDGNNGESTDDGNNDESAENGEGAQENPNPVDEIMEEADAEQAGEPSDKNDPGEDTKESAEMLNTMVARQDVFGHGMPDTGNNHMPNTVSATQPNGDSHVSDSKNVALEDNISNTSEAYAPSKSLPSGPLSEMDMKVYDPSNNGKFTDEQQKAEMHQKESLSVQKTQPNPYRNIGDALEKWKESVKVSVDLQEDNKEAPGELEDADADEYGYVPEHEMGTNQTLGPATSEQIDRNISKKSDEDNSASLRDEITDMEIDKQISEEWNLKNPGSIMKNKKQDEMHIPDSENPNKEEESPDVHEQVHGDPGILSESSVSVKKSYLNEDIYQLSRLSVDDNQLGHAQNPGQISFHMKQNATALWRRYELTTTRLSQELTEQLRLVLEPTLASKLQGDYKTGKRINMKKVIPYIASHYRKDKIWLRRTRPNKRDYQVLIAVDDSRSMSENSCGDVAVESLVTVCRAMSQLEIGNLAVASFGKKGNIKLLHDFDQPFNGEAGVKIISNLTFSQENMIVDEPVVDLLVYLNNMLDAAVVKARLPSGQNPLQQLVLIIADGRFHEKEKLRRYVRDFLSRKRMVAFLLLDNPQESVMDQMEASFVGDGQNRTLKFTKYLDSFPFPYYIVLRNIEALPRTLGDLLRQWFEMLQYSKE